MKPHFHKVPVKPESSFSIKHECKPNFGSIWHYHPELELHFIIRGEGVRLIGDNICNFSAGEILLLGSNLPHTWRGKEQTCNDETNPGVEVITIHFLPECLGKDILNLPEAYLLPKLFEKAKKGMFFTGRTCERLSKLMIAATETSDLDTLIIMLTILKTLAETEDYEHITSAHAFYSANESDSIRLHAICSYTLSNYKKDIKLKDIAAISHLSVTSFCRFFKSMTKKTFYDFLIEIRVSHACRYLIEDNLPTAMICFECGFNNVSNFYRHFKSVKGITPLEFKRKYLNRQILKHSVV